MLLMVSSSDHVAGIPGASLTVTLSKAGGAFGASSPTIVDRGAGWYSVALVGGNTDTLGDLAIHATAAGCDPTDALIEVVAYDPQDATALGLSRVDAAITSRSTLTQAQIVSDSTPFLGASVATIKGKTDNLPASPAAVGSAMTLAANAVNVTSAPNLDAAITSRMATFAYTAPDNATISTMSAALLIIDKVLRNKTVTDPGAGTITVYESDGFTPAFVASLFEDAAGVTPYRSQGAERRERLA